MHQVVVYQPLFIGCLYLGKLMHDFTPKSKFANLYIGNSPLAECAKPIPLSKDMGFFEDFSGMGNMSL
jgi:hypothetical protein